MSIAAQEWTRSSAVDDAVFARWPDYRVVLVAADVVDVDGLRPVADALLEQARAAVASRTGGEPTPHVQRWHDAYRDFGVKPRVGRVSVDALTRRAASDAGLPRINVLVDLYNAISVLHGVPIGGEDLDHYAGPARLVLANGDEPFLANVNGEPIVDHPEVGEPVWIDDEGVTCRRWNWRQTTRTAIREQTARVGFIIDSLEAPDHAGARSAAAQLVDLIPSAIVRVIDRTDEGATC